MCLFLRRGSSDHEHRSARWKVIEKLFYNVLFFKSMAFWLDGTPTLIRMGWCKVTGSSSVEPVAYPI
jgi:hypothetical protein